MCAIGSAERNELNSINARIAIHASRQRGLITTQQLRACGLTPPAITRRVQNRLLFRAGHGVYAVGAPVADELTMRLVRVLEAPAGSALGAVAAIEARAFTRFRADTIDIEVPRQCRLERAGVEYRRTNAQADGHVRTVYGVPITSLPWSIVRAGRRLNSAQLCHVVHQASWRHLLHVEEVQVVLDAHPTWSGHSVAAAAIAAYRAGSAGTRTFLEDTFIEMFEEVAGWTPIANLHVHAGWHSIEVDIPLLDRGVCIEVDGPPHDEPTQQAEDAARDALLNMEGLHVERFHWRSIKYRRRECLHRLNQLING